MKGQIAEEFEKKYIQEEDFEAKKNNMPETSQAPSKDPEQTKECNSRNR